MPLEIVHKWRHPLKGGGVGDTTPGKSDKNLYWKMMAEWQWGGRGEGGQRVSLLDGVIHERSLRLQSPTNMIKYFG